MEIIIPQLIYLLLVLFLKKNILFKVFWYNLKGKELQNHLYLRKKQMVTIWKGKLVNSDSKSLICLNDQLMLVKGVIELLDKFDNETNGNVLVN